VLQAIVRLAVLAILLISAAAVTKLMAIKISSTRNIVWSSDIMQQKINAAMQVRLKPACCMHEMVQSAFILQVRLAEWLGDEGSATNCLCLQYASGTK
jgi:hypothetical protein